jgi:hypothetical protein
MRLLASKNPWAKQWLNGGEMPEGRSWSLYETHMLTGRADGTPFWKDHMFRRILQDASITTDDQRAAALSAYGFSAFKSAVNRYLDKETYKKIRERGNHVIYGNEPVGGDPGVGAQEWFDLHPADVAGIQDQVFRREIEHLCKEKLLAPLFEKLAVKSKFALAASYSETTLNNPALLSSDLQQVHGCNTDAQLYHARDAAVRAVASVAKKSFPPSPEAENRQRSKFRVLQDYESLAVTLLEMLSERCFSWAKSEKWSLGVF